MCCIILFHAILYLSIFDSRGRKTLNRLKRKETITTSKFPYELKMLKGKNEGTV